LLLIAKDLLLWAISPSLDDCPACRIADGCRGL
jgi:hypothetical protein